MKHTKHVLFVAGFLFAVVGNAQIKLPRLISDGMVLQQDEKN